MEEQHDFQDERNKKGGSMGKVRMGGGLFFWFLVDEEEKVSVRLWLW